jgi:hypothetical protein
MRILLLFSLVLIGFLIGSLARANDPIVTESTSEVISSGTMETTVNSPPPSAISPNISNSNSDLCTVGVAGAVQTQILGISAGTTFTEENCLLLKKASIMYDMGMRVSAVSIMCSDKTVFDAMLNAGTPCPKDGLVGDKARLAWEMQAVEDQIEYEQNSPVRNIFDGNTETKIGLGVIISTLAFLLAM